MSKAFLPKRLELLALTSEVAITFHLSANPTNNISKAYITRIYKQWRTNSRDSFILATAQGIKLESLGDIKEKRIKVPGPCGSMQRQLDADLHGEARSYLYKPNITLPKCSSTTWTLAMADLEISLNARIAE